MYIYFYIPKDPYIDEYIYTHMYMYTYMHILHMYIHIDAAVKKTVVPG